MASKARVQEDGDEEEGVHVDSTISRSLQQASEGLTHLSIKWPEYANVYGGNVLDILKLIQVQKYIVDRCYSIC